MIGQTLFSKENNQFFLVSDIDAMGYVCLLSWDTQALRIVKNQYELNTLFSPAILFHQD